MFSFTRSRRVSALILGAAFVMTMPLSEATEVQLSPEDDAAAIVRKAAQVKPSARQWAWQQLEYIAFIHFGVNAFTDREWGDGTEDPAIFNPKQFDADQWAGACRDAGMRMIILTCKHHDGFCLWPSEYTTHSVASSPWRGGQGDLVGEVAEACRRHGLKFGVYLSPWDRNQPCYGDSPRYNDYFCNQLRELLSNYGEVSEVWFDGACGEGPNGKRQEYDWARYYAVVRECQPQACIAICGPDVRWCGNEAGRVRGSEWSVVPAQHDATAADIGGLDKLKEAAKAGQKLIWKPAEVNTSIRPGWFYHADQDDKVKPLAHLLDVYYGSVGGNAVFLLNLPPDQRGLIHENDVARLREVRAVLDATFGVDLAQGAAVEASSSAPGHGPEAVLGAEGFWRAAEGAETAALTLALPELRTFNRAMLQEPIAEGQRIAGFALEVWRGGAWEEAARATVVGYKRLLRFDDVTGQRVRIRLLESRLEPQLARVGLFFEPPILEPPAIARDAAGNVTLRGQAGAQLAYKLAPDADLTPYAGPFPLPEGGVVYAETVPPEDGRFVDLGQGLSAAAEFGLAATGWRVHHVSSEQNAQRAAAMAFDGDPATFWHSQRPDGAPELALDLGRVRAITGFTCLPRQDHAQGRIVGYACYVSRDGRDWGAPVVRGAFDNIENNPNRRTVRFAHAVEGRYIRIQALSTAQDKPYASIAELGVLTHARE